ncbi:hypothetical protein L1987_79119 [Smallanthus sonchifolius]|uniref:Uncharacterized protein n=1 Tax=Smallanthus sonchifolius TaxID=185202 RepID=A0ACB8ZEI8_9ASTR|nr:hypothetical protein L1987_79119 [Smallanthus sonchifolius]
MRAPWIFYYCFALFLILNYSTTTAQPPFDYPTAKLSTTWTTTGSSLESFNFIDGSRIRAILLRGSFGPTFACGFYCNGTCISYLFSVFIVQTNSVNGIVRQAIGFPQVVWSANRDLPVSDDAILNLTSTGDLVLQDADGSTVWTTNTTGKSVAGLNLTEDGNLVLFDVNRSVVWQSFDHPTDCLVLGQRLFVGQQLIPSVSSTNWTAQKGLFSLQVTDNGLFAYVGSNPAQTYYPSYSIYDNSAYTGTRYVRFLNGSLSLFSVSYDTSYAYTVFNIPQASSAQYIKFMPDGHLKVFEWNIRWFVVADLFNDYASFGECDYPLACGRIGICSGNQQCTCPAPRSPSIDYFRAVNDRQPNLGCSEVTPLTCNATQYHTFFTLENIRYFNIIADMEKVDIDTCKQACVNNCSCKAAIFDNNRGDCFLPFELFTMINVDPNERNNSVSAFIKIQNVRSPPSSPLGVILTSTIGSVLFLLAVTGFIIYIIRKRRRATQTQTVEESIREMLCGRKNFDQSQPEESWHLLGVLQKCWEQGILLDMVDKYSEDMQAHSSEVVEMMKVASWCLQYDYTKRPSMSIVVKVLEGVMKVESSLDYNFTDPRQQNIIVEHEKDMTPLLASVLSGPR